VKHAKTPSEALASLIEVLMATAALCKDTNDDEAGDDDDDDDDNDDNDDNDDEDNEQSNGDDDDRAAVKKKKKGSKKARSKAAASVVSESYATLNNVTLPYYFKVLLQELVAQLKAVDIKRNANHFQFLLLPSPQPPILCCIASNYYAERVKLIRTLVGLFRQMLEASTSLMTKPIVRSSLSDGSFDASHSCFFFLKKKKKKTKISFFPRHDVAESFDYIAEQVRSSTCDRTSKRDCKHVGRLRFVRPMCVYVFSLKYQLKRMQRRSWQRCMRCAIRARRSRT
jgi:hypothetical protein